MKPEGFICSDVDLNAVQRRPSDEEQSVIEFYRGRYLAHFGYLPHGLHYIDGHCVWLPPQDGSVEREIEGVPAPN
jgi:hypothetical protein